MNRIDIVSARLEAHYLMQLNHNHIIKVIDIFECDSVIVIVLPLMQQNLREYIMNREGPLSEDEAKAIFKMISSAVDHCHSKGIMHCDLKLDNILVNTNDCGQITDLCISDFGLSSNIKEMRAGDDSRGSLPYMAPEQLV